jgi:hypothetical protein
MQKAEADRMEHLRAQWKEKEIPPSAQLEAAKQQAKEDKRRQEEYMEKRKSMLEKFHNYL